MKRFVEGVDRSQSVLFPARLDDYIDEENPVRVIDVFVDELDLAALGRQLQEAPDQQISLTDPDARSMMTRGAGIVGYNVQTAVDAMHHLIVAHEVTNVGSDRAQLTAMATRAGEAMGQNSLTALADRGYFKGEEILACEQSGITPLVPKPLTSNSKADGRFDKRDFRYLPDLDVYQCPAGEHAPRRFSSVEKGMVIQKYWTSACPTCPLRTQCTTSRYRRISRWEHESVLETMQDRLNQRPDAMRDRRRTVEHPFGTLKAWMGATHFLTRTLPKVATEMSLHVLAYNMKRVMKIIGVTACVGVQMRRYDLGRRRKAVADACLSERVEAARKYSRAMSVEWAASPRGRAWSSGTPQPSFSAQNQGLIKFAKPSIWRRAIFLGCSSKFAQTRELR
jgi:hypothetical protein